MCLSPKRMLHRSNHFDCVQYPLYLNVPCGECFECMEQYHRSWFIRALYEYYDHRDSSFFYTTTYNPRWLPKYAGTDFVGFSKRHVTLFLKRLRKRLSRLGVKLRYIVTCEYGDLYGRPHYHWIFFLSFAINPYDFYKMVQEEWSVYDSSTGKYESLGFIECGDNVGLISDSRGVQYVTKYVVKDVSYMSKFSDRFKVYLFNRYYVVYKWLCRRYPSFYPFAWLDFNHKVPMMIKERGVSDLQKSIFDSFVNAVLYKYRSFLPFHLQSSNFGARALDYVTPNYKLPLETFDGFIEVELPRYLQRKLWYDVLPNERDGKRTRFVLNEAGRKRAKDVIEQKVDRQASEYSDLLHVKVDTEVLLKVNQALSGTKYFFDSCYSLQSFLDNFDLDVHRCAVYSRVFRDRFCDLSFEEDEDVVFDNWQAIFDYHLDCFSHVDMGKVYTYDRSYIKTLEKRLFNSHPALVVYDFACEVLDVIGIVVRGQICRRKEYEREQARVIRQLEKKRKLGLR